MDYKTNDRYQAGYRLVKNYLSEDREGKHLHAFLYGLLSSEVEYRHNLENMKAFLQGIEDARKEA